MTSSKITVRTALAPQGATKVGTESYYDEWDCKVYYEYTYIDWEDISDERVDVDMTVEVGFTAAREIVRGILTTFGESGTQRPGMMEVYMVNISTPDEQSFIATGYMTLHDQLTGL